MKWPVVVKCPGAMDYGNVTFAHADTPVVYYNQTDAPCLYRTEPMAMSQ